MMAMWIRSASKTALQHPINRYNTVGIFSKVSISMPVDRISPYSVLSGVRSKRLYAANDNNYSSYNNNVLFAQHSVFGVRKFSDKTPSSIPPPPHPPNLPDREQLERAFFRVVAFLWDYGQWIFAWSHRMIKMHIIEKPMVKFYWKRFHEKMEEARKDP